MRKSLLVGINDYPDCPLRGCVNDIMNMNNLLVGSGFNQMKITILENKDATKENIMSYLKIMVNCAQEEDHLVFHFSGHGSQVPDTEGDEEDSMDEILCPYDFDWNGGYIKDDDLRSIFEGLNPKATIDIILDCCHSGTGLREIDEVAKFIPYPGAKVEVPVFRGLLQEHDFPNVALWAGCRSNQTSADAVIDGQPQGAMTWAFCRNLRSVSRMKIIGFIQHDLSCAGYDQIPQLEATKEMKARRIFE